jgi:uncharacterized protein YxeA
VDYTEGMKKVLITLCVIVVVIVVAVGVMTKYATAPDNSGVSASPSVSAAR